MGIERGSRNLFARDVISLQPAPPERLELELAPRSDTVSSFVHTRASEQAWAAVNQAMMEPAGVLFWIGGPAGCGKTHFLNYVLALAKKAGTLESLSSRHVTCGFEMAGRTLAAEMEANLLDVLAEAIGGSRRQASLWQDVRGETAMMVAMEQARRTGIREVTVAIDFSLAEVEPAAKYFASLAEVARSCKLVRLIVLAAGRGAPPAGARALGVAPRDAEEAMRVALGRVRKLDDEGGEPIDEAYERIDIGGFAAREIFPFHPASLSTIHALANPPGSIAAAARLMREVLAPVLEEYAFGFERLVCPADVMGNPIAARRADAVLGEAGASAAVARSDGNERELARQIVETLIAAHLAAPDAALGPVEMVARVPMLAAGVSAWPAAAIGELIRKLAAASSGAIDVIAGAARFNPAAASAPGVLRFNTGLPLARHFIADLQAAHDEGDLWSSVARLGDAMANAIENAARTRRTLATSLAEAHLELPPAQEQALSEYVALGEGGPEMLMEIAADPARHGAAAQTITRYEGLAAAAAAVPRMRAMREYLEASGLRVCFDDDSSRDPRVSALETECQLLAAEIGPRAVAGAPRNLDAIEARFQKFKWTYVQLYRTAHDRWRAEIERLAIVAEDARRYLDVLGRLNSITALGPQAAPELDPLVRELTLQIGRCEFEGTLAAEVTPRCPSCGFLLGTQSPRADLEDAMERVRRALEVKLAALSQSAIARIILQHDHAHRLEGFLKITQAAQTDALVRVLDERLARYLARLLDENLGAARGGAVVAHLEHRGRRSRGIHPTRRK
jgi:hypothetical protein